VLHYKLKILLYQNNVKILKKVLDERDDGLLRFRHAPEVGLEVLAPAHGASQKIPLKRG
jgi:hypothetical protein